MSCPNCKNYNPHNEYEEAYYDYEYVDSEYMEHQCSCYYEEGDDEFDALAELNEHIDALHDVSDIVAALTGMDPDDPTQVRKLVHGVAFRDTTVLNNYGDATEAHEGEAPSELRVLAIDPEDVYYVSDLENMCKVLRGDLEDLFYCDFHGEHGAESPLKILKLMRALTKHDPESLIIDNFEQYKAARHYDGVDVDEDEYEDARSHVVTIEHQEYTYTYLIDRKTQKVYLQG